MTKFWPFRLFPKSLYGQILLVAASALLLAQGINAALLLAGTRSRAVTEATTMVVSRVANQIERQQERLKVKCLNASSRTARVGAEDRQLPSTIPQGRWSLPAMTLKTS
jgi:hypothetical protein